MKTFVDHTVVFILDDQDDDWGTVYRNETGYVRLEGVTVHLRDGDRGHNVWAGGTRCRKDGQIGKGWGRTSTSIRELPHADQQKWIDRALAAAADSAALDPFFKALDSFR